MSAIRSLVCCVFFGSASIGICAPRTVSDSVRPALSVRWLEACGEARDMPIMSIEVFASGDLYYVGSTMVRVDGTRSEDIGGDNASRLIRLASKLSGRDRTAMISASAQDKNSRYCLEITSEGRSGARTLQVHSYQRSARPFISGLRATTSIEKWSCPPRSREDGPRIFNGARFCQKSESDFAIILATYDPQRCVALSAYVYPSTLYFNYATLAEAGSQRLRTIEDGFVDLTPALFESLTAEARKLRDEGDGTSDPSPSPALHAYGWENLRPFRELVERMAISDTPSRIFIDGRCDWSSGKSFMMLDGDFVVRRPAV